MWDPGTYSRFGDERSRPFHDLVARIGADAPREVVDLGCGSGALTATLAGRWPGARVAGLDASPEMIAAAAEAAGPRVRFAVGDVTAWAPGPHTDVVVSNAVLQWVPGHAALLTRWAGALPAGAWLAFQVPGNFAAPSHVALREVAAGPRWAGRLGGLLREAPVDDAAGYAALLTRAGCAVDAWETVYVHLLRAGSPEAHPVLRWMEGTALRPVRAALGGDTADWAAFRAELGERLAAAYPADGPVVPFPFRRVFVVATTTGENP
ncbi:trans-aconitate 2-methyltransferase [Spirilliplanes yamanashiensis]|uniref:Trans-aconitate 2-methyltransferase n=1 Tax=Spirilliplanes yamanashiensis TaxID=42233 RepID=A0A8J3YCC3_9ACTN|nr:trans-aconitate 2-methyltransferase [Spirilliplanes yamanashiensis]MDP9818700.1 trans-aconitate 2-methyltransferase [Spirilliplanes yamanashiensis]GIJ05155.1 trans-aconitate 2-methyltransferase [Spirilliplanes yamanashiensis]